MTEQTRNITEAVIAKTLEDRKNRTLTANARRFVAKMTKHSKTLRTLHHFGSTEADVQKNKSDPYFSTWFEDARNGDLQVMHSILDHFEPLEIITNLGHNYRCKFSADETEVIFDFREGTLVPALNYQADGTQVKKKEQEEDEHQGMIKSYLYSCILRIAKELTLYFPLSKLSFIVSSATLNLDKKKFEFNAADVQPFMEEDLGDDFVSSVENVILS